MIESNDDNDARIAAQIERLAGKPNWPHYAAAQFELARVAKKYAKDLAHLSATIDDICEESDQCPDSRDLKQALMAGNMPERYQDLGCPHCEGSGFQIISGRNGETAARRCPCGSQPPREDPTANWQNAERRQRAVSDLAAPTEEELERLIGRKVQ